MTAQRRVTVLLYINTLFLSVCHRQSNICLYMYKCMYEWMDECMHERGVNQHMNRYILYIQSQSTICWYMHTYFF